MKNDAAPPRGHGVDSYRYPTDAIRGNNRQLRQLDLRFAADDHVHQVTHGVLKLRPGLWRIINGAGIFNTIWFRLHEPFVMSQTNPPFFTDGSFAEPILGLPGYRDVWVDGDGLLFYAIPLQCFIVAVLLSEQDDP